MKEEFKLVSPQGAVPGCDLKPFGPEQARQVQKFHQSFPIYRPTPLVSLSDTARVLGLDSVYVKDESHRFGLNAFKVLGGSYAIGRYLADLLGMDPDKLSYEAITAPETKAALGEITFVTATDGNHGRGIAWTATQLGQKSVVYMPRGSARERLENIRAAGAQAQIIDGNYDEAVRLANRQAEKNGWVFVQDTAWDGYETIPTRIMQGYGTMALEAWEQLPEAPTHIFLQAGVGSMAGSVTALFAALCREKKPVITIVEPNKADCHYRTAKAGDGKLHTVTGDMDTIMAGLACGEPCSISWPILANFADCFLSCPDRAAAKGMRLLSSPPGGDQRIISGESGAAAFGCVAQIMTDPSLSWLRDALKLDSHSRVLFFSTEGDTDQAGYRSIVWDGAFPTVPAL